MLAARAHGKVHGARRARAPLWRFGGGSAFCCCCCQSLNPDASPCRLSVRFEQAVLDGVHLDLSDDDGFAAACAQGRALGFDGKTLIHPKARGALFLRCRPVGLCTRPPVGGIAAAAGGRGNAPPQGAYIYTSPSTNVMMFHLSNCTRLAIVLNRVGRCS